MPRRKITGNVRDYAGGPVAYKLRHGRRLRKYVPRRSKPSSGFAKKVMAIVKRQTEHKYVAEYMLDSLATGYVNFNGPINTAGDWYRCIPLLPQATSQANSYTRVGKEISPDSLMCHWNFSLRRDANSRDIIVVLYVLQSTQYKRYSSMGINGVIVTPDDYLDKGNGTDSAFLGRIQDYQSPVERDKYRLLHKKSFHLHKPSGDANGAGVVGQYDAHGSGEYSNGKNSVAHSWRCKLPKKLKYDETGGNVNIPTNASPIWAAGYYYTDGSAVDTGGGLLSVDFWAGLKFRDD